MKLSKTFTFDAAHHLPNYKGKCANVHGHAFQYEVVLEGEVDPKSGMVIDFKILKEIGIIINEKLDHHDLNDILPNPTAEKIAEYLYNEWSEAHHPEVVVIEVNVWEQPMSKVSYP